MPHGPVRLVRLLGALGRLCLTAALLPGLPAGAEVSPEVAVRRLSREVQIDGRLDAQEWSGAARVDSFVQLEPRRGEAAQEQTEAFVAYDDRFLYVAFRCHDRQPQQIVAQLTRRDSELEKDDAVLVLLDTFSDHRTAYYFMTNALGTQADGRINDNGRVENSDWDGSWKSAASRFEGGWTAELAIPFSTLRFRPGSPQSWGFNLGRTTRRLLEFSFWSGPLDDWSRVSQFGRLTGLDLGAAPRRYEIVPYGLSRLQQRARADYEMGGDSRYAITPDNVVNLTVNPDFATVEADQELVNLTRFEVDLQEKRPFFLEGSEQFRQRIQTLYSRRIAEIRGGLKALGQAGGYQYSVLSAQSEPFLPSPTATSVRSANYSVLGVQHSIRKSSSVGLVATNRHLAGEDRGAVGVDTTLFFPRAWGFTGQLVRSHGPEKGGRWGFFLRPALDRPNTHLHVRYTHLGDRFGDHVNAVGLVKDDDRREIDAAFEKTLWSRTARWERIGYDSNYNVYWSQKGRLRSWQIEQELEIEGRNRWSTNLSHTEEYQLFEKEFRNRSTGIGVGYNRRQWQSFEMKVQFGRNFDADHRLLGAKVRRKVTARGALEYELERLWIDPDPKEEATVIHVLKASYNFTPDLYVRTFFQTNSSIRRRNVQASLVWRYRPPFGSFQLVFQRGTAAFGQPSSQGNTLFTKLSYVF
jgi:hypothetical protein